jgi:hypothetical protein
MDREELEPGPLHHGVDGRAAGGLDGHRHRTALEALLELIEPTLEALSGVRQSQCFKGLIFDAEGDSVLGVAPIEADESGPLDWRVWGGISFHR